MGSINDIIKEALKNPPTYCALVFYNNSSRDITILPEFWKFSENKKKETYYLSFTFKKTDETDEIEEYLNHNKDKPIYFDFKFLSCGKDTNFEMAGYVIELNTNRLCTATVVYQPTEIHLIYPPIQLIARVPAKKINFEIKLKKEEQK